MIASLLRNLNKGHHSLGIEVTDEAIKLCEIREKRDRSVRIVNYAAAPLPAGAVKDGRIIELETMQSTLKELLAVNKIGARHVHFAIPSPTTMVRLLQLPDIPHHELKKLVQYEMKHNVHVAFEQPHYDFVKLATSRNAAEKAVNPVSSAELETAAALGEPVSSQPLADVLVAAAPLQVLEAYNELFMKLKLIPDSFEIKAFSMIRLLEKTKTNVNGLHLIVDVNRTSSELTIIEDGVFRMTRTAEISFKSMTEGAVGESREWLSAFASPEQTFANAVQDLASELERLMNFYFYTLTTSERHFQSIIVTGDVEEMDKLQEGLRSNLRQPVVVPNWSGLNVTDTADDWSYSDYAVPLGLALRGKEG
ncbi:type IV pilus biogenesis protein PilM [Paenibacillus radicis (ex Gao et al. 2016)]|uniref:Pilus assembly protein PilM n=1 Tax=Paenibacillus radicis (ex Gao et al. 2016) TaxID=1737354 RepID=A0A917LT94_9BACL|nr:pilus assembly protein PilM [Paenibacillus radicis (ex Gao et al. 2016)]GGG55538.1 pilus assembly protein PilM [Paenibacillus radicis (ex Gao et al. 2016)]